MNCYECGCKENFIPDPRTKKETICEPCLEKMSSLMPDVFGIIQYEYEEKLGGVYDCLPEAC